MFAEVDHGKCSSVLSLSTGVGAGAECITEDVNLIMEGMKMKRRMKLSNGFYLEKDGPGYYYYKHLLCNRIDRETRLAGPIAEEVKKAMDILDGIGIDKTLSDIKEIERAILGDRKYKELRDRYKQPEKQKEK